MLERQVAFDLRSSGGFLWSCWSGLRPTARDREQANSGDAAAISQIYSSPSFSSDGHDMRTPLEKSEARLLSQAGTSPRDLARYDGVVRVQRCAPPRSLCALRVPWLHFAHVRSYQPRTRARARSAQGRLESRV